MNIKYPSIGNKTPLEYADECRSNGSGEYINKIVSYLENQVNPAELARVQAKRFKNSNNFFNIEKGYKVTEEFKNLSEEQLAEEFQKINEENSSKASYKSGRWSL